MPRVPAETTATAFAGTTDEHIARLVVRCVRVSNDEPGANLSIRICKNPGARRASRGSQQCDRPAACRLICVHLSRPGASEPLCP